LEARIGRICGSILYPVKTETFAFIYVNLLEKATGEGLKDIGFNKTRMSKINGIDIRIAKTWISGELSYEL
jgi:hypothetical protein